jgi:hypothetical protein
MLDRAGQSHLKGLALGFRRKAACEARKWSRGIPQAAGNVAEAKEAAEKGLVSGERPEEHPSGAKALVDLIAFTARLKPCPFKTVFQQEFFRSL